MRSALCGWSRVIVRAPIDATAVTQALSAAGYPVHTATVIVTIEAMSCVSRVERSLISVPGVVEARAAKLAERGRPPLFAAVDDKLATILATDDPVKPGAVAFVRALHDQGLRTAIITGDNRATAAAIAAELGIDDVTAEVCPHSKVEAVMRLKQQGAVAYVGDGINDAPALAAADIGTGTDIESADFVLVSGKLEGVVNARTASRRMMINIRRNLFWAFAYNSALVPLAAGFMYPLTGTLLSPARAAGAMAASAICVLANALRLRQLRPAIREDSGRTPTCGLQPAAAA
mgnify:CR=1 FL=1